MNQAAELKHRLRHADRHYIHIRAFYAIHVLKKLLILTLRRCVTMVVGINDVLHDAVYDVYMLRGGGSSASNATVQYCP